MFDLSGLDGADARALWRAVSAVLAARRERGLPRPAIPPYRPRVTRDEARSFLVGTLDIFPGEIAPGTLEEPIALALLAALADAPGIDPRRPSPRD